MDKRIYVVKIRVYTDELLAFYKDDPSFGTKEKPLPAESFYELTSPYALFWGPLKNILIFDNDCIYNWEIETANGEQLDFSTNDESVMELKMLTDKPSEEKWRKVFKNAPAMDPSGKIKIKPKTTTKNEFELQTSDNVADGGNIKYSFVFEFKTKSGGSKFAIIDPMSITMPPPPPPIDD